MPARTVNILIVFVMIASGFAEEGVGAERCGTPPTNNRFGAWIFLISETGYTHAEMAAQLAALGVKRVYIKIADDTHACDWFPDACDPAVPAVYKAHGVQPWAWSYNYPGLEDEQADALYLAASLGYQGYVADLEIEFNGLATELHDLLGAFAAAQQRADQDGLIRSDWAFAVTTWGNPGDHNMRVDIIDQYVDFHMPQTYIELWGGIYLADPRYSIELGNCEYRTLGANKPIHHIVSAETGTITATQIDTFFQWAGPQASLWRVPGGAVSTSIWQVWQSVDFHRRSFSDADCVTPGPSSPTRHDLHRP